MARKKKKTKHQAQQQIQGLTPAQLIQSAKTSLRNDAFRAAIDVLRFTVKKHGLSPEVRTLLFDAVLSRAEQLLGEGKNRVAETTAAQVNPLAADVSWLTETDLVRYVSLCSGPEAFDAYTQYVRLHKRIPEAENRLASHLLGHRQWSYADRLDGSVPLLQEVDAVRRAVPLMDKGDWETALDGLRGLSRKSPFAPVRLLCRAMSAFYAENDADAVKALSMIPDYFPLSGTTSLLKDILQTPEDTDARQTAMSRLPVLWEGAVHLKKELRDLIRYLERGDIRESARIMRRTAQSAFPENTQAFLILLLQMTWKKAVLCDKLDPDAYLKLASNLLPEPQAKSLHSRFLFGMGMSLIDAADYLESCLANDFPDPAERNIAHALVLLHVVRKLHQFRLWENPPPKSIPAGRSRAVLGMDPAGTGIVPVEMAAKALSLDPANRDGYLLMAELPRTRREERKKVEAALLTMMQTFPDDPVPCLELASVYYESNAFRKAENILEEAMRRAPHDNRVVDKHALSLLVSAQKNIRRQKFHLAGPDIERAATLGSKYNAPFITAKRLLLSLIDPSGSAAVLKDSPGQLSLFGHESDFSTLLDQEMQVLSMPDRLRTLTVLFNDLESENFSQKKSILKFLTGRLKKNLKQVKNMSSSDIVRILSPLEKEYASVFERIDAAPLLLKHNKKLLGIIKDDDITTAYDLMMHPDIHLLILKDIRKRLKRAGAREKVILRFHQAVVRHLADDRASYDLFLDVLEDAPEETWEELRGISRRLSRHATGRLREVLALFHFGPRPGDFPFPSFQEDGRDEDDFPFFNEDEDDEWDDDFPDPGEFAALSPKMLSMIAADAGKHPEEFADMIEAMVDDMDLRDEPEHMVIEIRKTMSKMQGWGELLDELARQIDPDLPAIDAMSRKAYIFLYGKRPGKNTRKRR